MSIPLKELLESFREERRRRGDFLDCLDCLDFLDSEFSAHLVQTQPN